MKWHQARDRGFVQSDQRGTIASWGLRNTGGPVTLGSLAAAAALMVPGGHGGEFDGPGACFQEQVLAAVCSLPTRATAHAEL